MGVLGFLRNLLPANLERYLRGIDFPIGKQELLRRLEHNGAPAAVVKQVGKRLSEGRYRSPQDFIDRLKGYPFEPAATVGRVRAWPPIGVVGGW